MPSHKGIWQNERADTAAKTAVKTLTTTNVNANISQAVSFARDFYLILPRYALRPAPRTITKQTRSTITRASAALATFLAKMILDCRYTMRNRSLFTGATVVGSHCCLCHSKSEIPQHLWAYLGVQASDGRDFDPFASSADLHTTWTWMSVLQQLF